MSGWSKVLDSSSGILVFVRRRGFKSNFGNIKIKLKILFYLKLEKYNLYISLIT